MKYVVESYRSLLALVGRNFPVLTIIFFAIGVWLGATSEGFADSIGNAMDSFIDGYGIFAPLVIYAILTPSLVKVLNPRGNGFVGSMMAWFAGTRLVAMLWAVVFTTVVFDLPLVSQAISYSNAISNSMAQLGWMVTHNVYFYAIYASLISVFVALRVEKVAAFFRAGATAIENLGEHLILLVPIFMLVIGAYIAALPARIGQQVAGAYAQQVGEAAAGGGISSSGIQLHSFQVLGIGIDPNTTTGMVTAYLIGALLTGIACFIWHGALLGLARQRVTGFSIRHYIKMYWINIYPLLWSTSSEALSAPLSLHLVRKHYPRISSEIRRFTVGGGSFLGINGTLICVYTLAGLVASILGVEVTFLQLLMSIPLIFLLGYGIPGIPGELIIFAGPISIIFGVPDPVIGVFLALYIGFQIGLPDSFRTGANSTDNCVNAVILQDIFERKYQRREPKAAEVSVDRADNA